MRQRHADGDPFAMDEALAVVAGGGFQRMADIPGGLPDAERLLAYIAQDKKVSRGALTFILTRGVGQAFIARDVPSSEVLSFLRENLPG